MGDVGRMGDLEEALCTSTVSLTVWGRVHVHLSGLCLTVLCFDCSWLPQLYMCFVTALRVLDDVRASVKAVSTQRALPCGSIGGDGHTLGTERTRAAEAAGYQPDCLLVCIIGIS
jgi:hypothetical protein